MKKTIQQLIDALELIFASTIPYREDGTCTLSDKAVDAANKAIQEGKKFLDKKVDQ